MMASAMTRPDTPGRITRMLHQWRDGDTGALNTLMDEVYDELKSSARARLSSQKGGFRPTALIHEVYLRARECRNPSFENRAHFFWYAGQMMRHILVDHYRGKNRIKRGAGASHTSLEEATPLPGRDDMDPTTILALDEALEELARLDARQARIIEMRFFAGLSLDEIAEVMGLSRMTISREQRLARIWLAERLGRSGQGNNRPPEVPPRGATH